MSIIFTTLCYEGNYHLQLYGTTDLDKFTVWEPLRFRRVWYLLMTVDSSLQLFRRQCATHWDTPIGFFKKLAILHAWINRSFFQIASPFHPTHNSSRVVNSGHVIPRKYVLIYTWDTNVLLKHTFTVSRGSNANVISALMIFASWTYQFFSQNTYYFKSCWPFPCDLDLTAVSEYIVLNVYINISISRLLKTFSVLLSPSKICNILRSYIVT